MTNDAANQHEQPFYQHELAWLQRELQAHKDTQDESHAPDEYFCGICGWQSLNSPCEHLPIRK